LREKLIETARRREIDSVIVWRLDRWGRSLVATQASGTTASIASNFSDGS
jgi:DNA invertase Pin-like site-specific DNA recombinase